MTTESRLSAAGQLPRARSAMWPLILGIMITAATLRAPLTGIGPLLGDIQDQMGLSHTLAGMLTTLPLIAFSIFSVIAPKVARRFGMEPTLMTAMLVMTAGIILRSVSSIPAVFGGTALIGIAIALCNVLVPTLIKRDFPKRIGIMTSFYSASMNGWAAIASGVSVPLAHQAGLGWEGSLVCWAALAFASAIIWLPQIRFAKSTQISESSSGSGAVWRSPLAWCITLFMGLQSFIFYISIAWLPEILKSRGISIETSGWLLSLMQLCSMVGSFIMPLIASRTISQRGLGASVGSLFVLGYLGIIFSSNALIPAAIVLLGFACGTSFSLAVMFFALRSRNTQMTSELSGMAQSMGYLLAAAGPSLFGWIHDISGGWKLPLYLLLIVAVLTVIFAFKSGRKGYVAA